MADPSLTQASAPPTPPFEPPQAPVRSHTPVPAPSAPGQRGGRYGWWARWLLGVIFAPVEFPASALGPLQQLSSEATLVYVVRSSSLLHLLYFNFAFWRLGLPLARAATGLGTRIFSPFARWYLGGKQLKAPKDAPGDKALEAVVEAARQGESALVFLRSPRTLSSALSDLPDPFPALVALARTQDRAKKPIVLVPLTLVWRRRPRHISRSWRDVLFGDPDEPGALRALFGFLLHRSTSTVKVGTTVELSAELARAKAERDGAAEGAASLDKFVARKVRGFLYQHLTREARVITGPPLKRPDRVAVETLRDVTLKRTLAEIARERGRADDSTLHEANACLHEIAATYNPLAVDFLKGVLRLVFNRIYDGVDIDLRGLQKLADAGAKGPLVLCPCHKSHIDYMILSWVLDEHGMQPPHIAAGENLNFWPVGRLLRMGGAFFIRRTFRDDKVYGATLSAYVKHLLRDGFTQEFFVEGGRSRTGKLLPPKFGMLAMEVDAWLSGSRSQDVFFAPISVSYEKLAEGQSYQRELAGGEKQKEDAKALLSATSVLRSRYGRIAIRFDDVVSLKGLFEERGVDPENHDAETRRKLVAALGWRVAAGINRCAPLAPMGTICAVLLSHDARALSEETVLARAKFLHEAAIEGGAHAATWHQPDRRQGDEGLPRVSPCEMALKALASLRAGGEVRVHEVAGERFWAVPDERRLTLDYHKNGILHFLVAPAVLAAALRSFDGQAVPLVELLRRAKSLSRILKSEFIYEPGRPFDSIVAGQLALLLRLGLAEKHGEPGHEIIAPTAHGAEKLTLLSELLRTFLEAAWVGLDGLTLLAHPMDPKEWTRRLLDRGRAAYLAGRILRQESLSKALLDNALASLKERGVIAQAEGKAGKLSRSPDLASGEKLAAMASEVDLFLR